MPQAEMTFESLDPPDLADWLVGMRATYVDDRIAAGDSQDEAEANVSASLERLVPKGSPAPGQLIGRVCCGGEPVGYLWIGPANTDPERWWVWEIVIDENHRSQGFGRQAMLLAEDLARDAGATTMGLNVFANNAAARGLYSSLGYEETSVQMRKPLSRRPAV